jgi:hypothetical protein
VARPLREVGGVDGRVGRGDEDLPAPGLRVGPFLEPKLVAVQHDRTHRQTVRENG